MALRKNNIYKSARALLVLPLILLIFIAFINASQCEYKGSVVHDSADYELFFISPQPLSNLVSFQKNNTVTVFAQFFGVDNSGAGSLSCTLNEAKNYYKRIFFRLRADRINSIVRAANRYYIFALNRMRN